MKSVVEETTVREPPTDAPRAPARSRPRVLRYLRLKSGTALLLWRVEARLATPVALLLIATLGRWPAALVAGAVMAVFSAVFLYLLDDDPVLDELRTWIGRRRLGRALVRLAERNVRYGKARRAVALVPAVMILGPFWRAVTFHLFRVRRPAAYLLSIGGSIPHALLWVGLVLGGLWGVLILPLLNALWSDVILPLAGWLEQALVLTMNGF
jgi:hypothetical protein